MTMRSFLPACLSLAAVAFANPAIADPPVAPFYASVASMKPAGKLGQVIAREKVATSIPGAVAWRIAYVSSDMADKKTISTGLVILPKAKPPKGGRPVLSWAHGTTGTAQNCGPSQVLDPAAPLNEYFLASGNEPMDYGVPAVIPFIKAGYAVVATDYQGLGGGGRHEYQLVESQARDAINAIRAVGSIKEAGASHTAIIYGWSQGAGAAIAAASSPDYLAQKGTAFDGIALAGIVAMAPPDFRTIAPPGPLTDASGAAMMAGAGKAFSNSVGNFNHLAMALWGAEATYPEKLKLTDIFTPEGATFVNEIMANKCVHGASDAITYAYADKFTTLLRPDPVNVRAWAQTLIDSAGPEVKPVAPVLIFWGTKDTVVPPLMHEIYRKRMCALGGNVARVRLAGEVTHFGTPGGSEPLYLPWVADRIAGKPAADGCAAEQVE